MSRNTLTGAEILNVVNESDTDSDEQYAASDKENSESEDKLLIFEDGQDSSDESGENDTGTDRISSRHGTNWWKNLAPDRGRCLQRNTLTQAPGLTNYSQNFKTPPKIFQLLFTSEILQVIMNNLEKKLYNLITQNGNY